MMKYFILSLLLLSTVFADIYYGGYNASSASYQISIFSNMMASSTTINVLISNNTNMSNSSCNGTNGTGITTINYISNTTSRGDSSATVLPYLIMIILVVYFIWARVASKK